MELSTKIRQVRAKLRLTAKQAAERWGINPRTLEDYEQGRRKPRGFALKALNELLDAAFADKPAEPLASATPPSSARPGTSAPPKALRRHLPRSAWDRVRTASKAR